MADERTAVDPENEKLPVGDKANPAPEATSNGGNLNVEAAEFVPKAIDEEDIMSKLPIHHRSKLRGFYQAYNGEYVAYYVGALKTYNNRTGYGFLECKQSKKDWGGDVFIHKNNVPVPWTVGQPVEFAVQVNNRGQPQAFDCNWLPRLPLPNHQAKAGQMAGVTRPPAGGYATGSPSAPEVTAPPGLKSQAPVEQEEKEPRRLGTLKSFSQTSGYGFIKCDEVHQAHQRDVYLDKNLLPATSWRFGQLMEFSVYFNARGHPQARKVNWEPVPLTSPAEPPSWKRNFSEKTVDQLKRLLKLLHEKSVETAVVTAIDMQGADKAAEMDQEVDCVFFVLDRLADKPKEEVLKEIKDFVKMLFVLMLAKMLRTQVDKDRTEQLISWYEAVAASIQVLSDQVKQHIKDVIQNMNGHLKTASADNKHLMENAQLKGRLHDAFQKLKDKAEGGS